MATHKSRHSQQPKIRGTGGWVVKIAMALWRGVCYWNGSSVPSLISTYLVWNDVNISCDTLKQVSVGKWLPFWKTLTSLDSAPGWGLFQGPHHTCDLNLRFAFGRSCQVFVTVNVEKETSLHLSPDVLSQGQYENHHNHIKFQKTLTCIDGNLSEFVNRRSPCQSRVPTQLLVRHVTL